MGFFDGSGDGNFDPTNWIDHNIYEDVMSDDEYDDEDYDYYEDENFDDDEDYEYDDENESELEEKYGNDNDEKLNEIDNEEKDGKKEEIIDDDKEFIEHCAKDDTNELYYTKLLLEKFPELKDKYSIYKWDAPLFMIKEIAESNDFDSALKYFQYLIDNVDYEYLLKKDKELANRLSLDIVRNILSALCAEQTGKYDQQVANFFYKKTKLFDLCFKYCDWKDWHYGLKHTLSNYMRLFEKVDNIEHEKLAYYTFIKYQKDIATTGNMTDFWYVFSKTNAMLDERLYDFYKEAISLLGEEKAKNPLYQLEYQRKFGDRIHIGFDRWYKGKINGK